MPASLGGSVVDPSLLRQAADRGVTICFADLDGADGLWVPEERTVLVNRSLSEAQVADVIEHELAHVMIDDQHADLDAGKDVVVGHPPLRSARPIAVALTAVALLGVVGGVWIGVNRATSGGKQDQVAPNPDGPGLTAQLESGAPRPSTTTTVVATRLPDGTVVYRTVVVTQTPSVPPSPTAGTLRPTPSPTRGVPSRPPGTSAPAPPPPGPTTQTPPPPPPSTNPPVTPTPDPSPSEAAPTTDGAADPVGGGAGDGAGDPVGDVPIGGASSPNAAGASAGIGGVPVEVSDPADPIVDPPL